MTQATQEPVFIIQPFERSTASPLTPDEIKRFKEAWAKAYRGVDITAPVDLDSIT